MACEAVHCHRAGGDCISRGSRREEEGPAAPAGLAVLARIVARGFRAGGCCLQCCRPPVPRGASSCRSAAAPSRCAGGRFQAGRYLLTCSASPAPRVGAGGIVQVRRCRQLPRSFAAGCGPRAGLPAPRAAVRLRAQGLMVAGLAVSTLSMVADAAPCHRAGGVHLWCCHQHARRASSTSRHNIPFERGGAMLSCRTGSPTVLLSAGATGQQHQ